MDTIVAKVRDLIVDNYKYNSEIQEYYGGAKIFPLQSANIDSTSLVVYKNGTVWADSNYSYDSDTSQVTVTGTLTAGDNLRFAYNAYEKYSDAELQGYIRAALYRLTAEKYKTFAVKPPSIIFPTPSEIEEDLIAIIASLLISGSIRSYRTPEFSITFEDGISVDKKITKLIQQYTKAYGYFDYIDLGETVEDDDEE